MIGLRVGPRSGRNGLAIGIGEDELHAFEATTLSVTLADSIDPAITSGAMSYTIVVTNLGAETAVGVAAYLTLDAQTTFVSGSGVGWSVSHSAGVVTCSISAVPTGPAATVTINVLASATPETSTAVVRAAAQNAPIQVTDSETTVVELVSRDATAGIYVPADATEWGRLITFFGLAVATPDGLWLCQDASGSLAAAIGPTPLTAVTSPLYQQSSPRWTRLGVGGDDATADRFNIPTGTAPNPTLASQTWMVFLYVGAVPLSTRQIVGINITSFSLGCRALYASPAIPTVLQANCVGASNNGVVDHVGDSNRVIMIKYDRTNSLAVAYSDLEAQATTYSAGINDGPKGFGGGGAALGGAVYTYAAMWTGANAEIADANVRALYQALGWTVGW